MNEFDSTSAGLPIGLQLIGRPWAEADLLYAGSVLETALQGSIKRPTIFCAIVGCKLSSIRKPSYMATIMTVDLL